MDKRIWAVPVALSLVLGGASTVLASEPVDPSPSVSPSASSQNNRERDEVRNRVMDKCSEVESKIGKKTAKFEQNRQIGKVRFDGMKTATAKLITELRAKGYDVTQLEQDQATLESLIAKFSTDYTNYMSSLEQTKQFACGKSRGEFVSQLETARSEIPAVQKDFKAVMDFWKNTFRPHFQAIKKVAQASPTPVPAASPVAD